MTSRLHAPDPLTDDELDALLPAKLAALAPVHFTPVEVARAAVELLAPQPGELVLDLGAGVGKFCIAAALARPDVTFVGVERRAALVDVGRELAHQLGATNVVLVDGDALAVDWTGYAGFYLFNPFGERSIAGAPRLDDEAVDADAFFAAARRASERLHKLPRGTRVVTYHGFGRRPPPGFEVTRRLLPSGPLERWLRR